MINELSVEIRYHHNKMDWTVYLFREGFGGLPVAHSHTLQCVPPEDVARQWVDFLGLDGFETSK